MAETSVPDPGNAADDAIPNDEEEAPKPPQREIPFGEPEWAAECMIKEVWTQVKAEAHVRDMKKKRFGFAAGAACRIMLGEVDICFTHIEPKPPIEGEGWDCEIEVPLPHIDNWATQAIRVRPKRLPKASLDVGTAGGVASKVEADPEEAHYRSAKEVEEQRRLDIIEAKEQRRKRIEAAQANVEAQVSAGSGQFTFDTEGNILLVELPKVERLPKVSTEFTFKHYDVGKSGATSKEQALASLTNKRSPKKPEKKQFEDGFIRLQEDRPPITDVISLRPGVVLQSGGQKIVGPQTKDRNMSLTGCGYSAQRIWYGIRGDWCGAGGQDAAVVDRGGCWQNFVVISRERRGCVAISCAPTYDYLDSACACGDGALLEEGKFVYASSRMDDDLLTSSTSVAKSQVLLAAVAASAAAAPSAHAPSATSSVVEENVVEDEYSEISEEIPGLHPEHSVASQSYIDDFDEYEATEQGGSAGTCTPDRSAHRRSVEIAVQTDPGPPDAFFLGASAHFNATESSGATTTQGPPPGSHPANAYPPLTGSYMAGMYPHLGYPPYPPGAHMYPPPPWGMHPYYGGMGMMGYPPYGAGSAWGMQQEVGLGQLRREAFRSAVAPPGNGGPAPPGGPRGAWTETAPNSAASTLRASTGLKGDATSALPKGAASSENREQCAEGTTDHALAPTTHMDCEQDLPGSAARGELEMEQQGALGPMREPLLDALELVDQNFVDQFKLLRAQAALHRERMNSLQARRPSYKYTSSADVQRLLAEQTQRLDRALGRR
eukprot:g4947.t1